MKKVYTYQPGRFGDILYTIPIARRLKEKGYDVYFMIQERCKSLIPHFPDINFVECSPTKPVPTESCIFLPLWHGANWKKAKGQYDGADLMTCKYEMYNEIFDDDVNPKSYWRCLTFKRFQDKEKELLSVLGLKEGEKYVLINEYCMNGRREIDVKTNLKKIYMGSEGELKKFDLLDWSLVMENADEIHTVHTSVIYMIEVLKTTTKLHLYERVKGKVPITHILNKKYILHT